MINIYLKGCFNFCILVIYCAMDILKKIKIIRRIKGLTQLDMSVKIGISLVNYNKLENGVNDMSFNRLSQIAGIFEMRVSEIVDYGEETGKDKEIIELKKEVLALKNRNTTLLRLSKFLYEKQSKERDFESLMDLFSHMIDDDTEISIHDDTLRQHILEDFEGENKTENERVENGKKLLRKKSK
jgi:transcriptional regulator with XRE-family HTH domain